MQRKVLTTDGAVAYMNGKGYPISKSTLYKQTMTGAIKFQRFGMRKIVFSPEELDQWIEERLSGGGKSEEITKTIAEAARRREAIA